MSSAESVSAEYGLLSVLASQPPHSPFVCQDVTEDKYSQLWKAVLGEKQFFSIQIGRLDTFLSVEVGLFNLTVAQLNEGQVLMINRVSLEVGDRHSLMFGQFEFDGLSLRRSVSNISHSGSHSVTYYRISHSSYGLYVEDNTVVECLVGEVAEALLSLRNKSGRRITNVRLEFKRNEQSSTEASAMLFVDPQNELRSELTTNCAIAMEPDEVISVPLYFSAQLVGNFELQMETSYLLDGEETVRNGKVTLAITAKEPFVVKSGVLNFAFNCFSVKGLPVASLLNNSEHILKVDISSNADIIVTNVEWLLADVLSCIGRDEEITKQVEDQLNDGEVISYCCVVAVHSREEDVECPLGRLAVEWKRYFTSIYNYIRFYMKNVGIHLGPKNIIEVNNLSHYSSYTTSYFCLDHHKSLIQFCNSLCELFQLQFLFCAHSVSGMNGLVFLYCLTALLVCYVEAHGNCSEVCLEDMARLRLEDIKMRLLSSIGLREPPNIDNIGLPPSAIQAGFQAMIGGIDDEDDLEEHEKTFIIAVDPSGILSKDKEIWNLIYSCQFQLGDVVATKKTSIMKSGKVSITLQPFDVERYLHFSLKFHSNVNFGLPLWWNSQPVLGLYVEAILNGENIVVHPQQDRHPRHTMFLAVDLMSATLSRQRRSSPVCTTEDKEQGCCLYNLIVSLRTFVWFRLTCSTYIIRYDSVKLIYMSSDKQITMVRVPGMIARKCSCSYGQLLSTYLGVSPFIDSSCDLPKVALYIV
uniref:REJ domain-containing protein n=1 Tax=Heterorhabditis bacteriophora TaxID=37862 RepID=A0A1I7WYX4_HETBA